MTRVALALALALAGLAGCNFDQLGKWAPINDRPGKPQGPTAHSRSLEIREACKSIGATAQSDLCRGVDKLAEAPAAAHH
ncbi:MAG: hypothetical protein H6706_30620 [Myxococcales bacterium]|nr:hypothetical protein [Myxococcales bacterium]